ncbi:MAG: FAD-dependent oxidoreductase [Deltaproteobacteria bacterium]|nr:FAD-dependent oxidoreductase [Deltaproteobacteria bacterium]
MRKNSELGGNLVPASKPPFKQDMRKFLDHLINRVKGLPVDIRLSTEAFRDKIKPLAPEVLILALGAEPIIPDLPGITMPQVTWAGDVLLGTGKVGNRVVILGGGLVGCETALFLSGLGKEVTVVEMKDEAAGDQNAISRTLLLELLSKQGVEIRKGMTVEEIMEDGVRIVDKGHKQRQIPAGSVVLALGLKSRTDVLEELQGLAPEVYVIGDCLRSRKLMDAIHEAFNMAIEL